MKVADLFVKIGLEGASNVQTGLKNVNKGFNNLIGAINKYALAAGAAIFGFAKLVKHSGKAAKELKVFEAITGASTKRLQEWQQAGIAFGITNEEMASSMKGVQEIFTKMRTGEAVPGGWARVSQVLGDVDIAKAATDPFHGLQELQRFARANQFETGYETMLLRTFGLSDKMIAALQKGAFTAKNFRKAIVLDKEEISQLAKVTAEWARLSALVTKVGAKIHALFGPPLIKILTAAVKAIGYVADALEAIISSVTKASGKLFGLGKKYGVDIAGIAARNPNRQSVMNNSLVFNQHFSGNADPKKVGDITKKAINDAATNLATIGQGN